MKTSLILAAMGLSLAASAAVADDSVNRLNLPRDQWLPAAQIVEKLAAQGYKVYEIESDDGVYEVEMTNREGVRVETHVHPATGELLNGYDD